MQFSSRQAAALADLPTPCAIVDEATMQRHIETMQHRMNTLGVAFRPHVKTTKCLEIARRQRSAGARGVTVSTLAEAEALYAAGFDDILYAVGLSPNKVQSAAALRRRGCGLTVIVDSIEAADAAARSPERLDVLIEIDSDGDRAGIEPHDDRLLAVAERLAQGAQLRGVLTHAGTSYQCKTLAQRIEVSERERAGAVWAAQRLRVAGHRCDIVSVGSTPTALSVQQLEGVTEVRAGVYVFQDLVMAGVGVATLDDIALAVLATVIGHRHDRRQVFVDAGWTALSRDHGPERGYGQVCDLNGRPVEGLIVSDTNQEHGVVSATQDACIDPLTLPIGSQWLILPNHACATAGQFSGYQVPAADGSIARWSRFGGW